MFFFPPSGLLFKFLGFGLLPVSLESVWFLLCFLALVLVRFGAVLNPAFLYLFEFVAVYRVDSRA